VHCRGPSFTCRVRATAACLDRLGSKHVVLVKVTVYPIKNLIAGHDLLKCLVLDLALELVEPLHVVSGSVFCGLNSIDPRAHLFPISSGLEMNVWPKRLPTLTVGRVPPALM
jgi:hypothetical protein